MKKITLFLSLALASLLFLNSCENITKIEKTFDGGYVEFKISPQAAGNYATTETFTIGLNNLIKEYELDLDKVKELYLENLEIEIIDTNSSLPAVTFDLVDKAQVEVEAQDIPRKLVAKKDPIPHTGLTRIRPDMEPDLDWLAIAKKDMATFHASGTLNGPLNKPIRMRAYITWRVVGELLN